MRHFTKILLLSIIISMFISIDIVSAETMEDQLNNLVGPRQHYNTMVSPAYLRSNLSEEYINPQTGELNLTQTDYYLPGRKGLDLEIKRIYKSSVSNSNQTTVKYENTASGWAFVDYLNVEEDAISFYEDRYNLGLGWRFSFPMIEIKENSDGTNFKFLHTESGDVYRIVEDGSNYSLENHPVKDVEIKVDTTFRNGTSKYVMVKKDGQKTYFDSDGYILGIKDRYGNEINFYYSNVTYTLSGQYTRTRKLISSIVDTVGRTVYIKYKEGIENANGTFNADVNSSNYKVTIYLPDATDSNLNDNKTIVYEKDAWLMTEGASSVVREELVNVKNVNGDVKYHFISEQSNLGFTYVNGTQYTKTNPYYYTINQIDSELDNKITKYNYENFTKKLGTDGSMQYRKITSKQEFAKITVNSEVVEELKNQISYEYTNEPDGYYYNETTNKWEVYPGYNDVTDENKRKDYLKYD